MSAPPASRGQSDDVWVVTGLSGAGKATALAALDRAGFHCVDNLPAALLPAFAEQQRGHRAAAVVDARDAELAALDGRATAARVLFLDARDDVLLRRLGDSARPHPLGEAGGGRASIEAERRALEGLRAAADAVIDTSELTPDSLGRRVLETVAPAGADGETATGIVCTVSSFGFKHGACIEADWMVDARFLDNPFWVAELRPLTGLDEAVHRFVADQPAAVEFVERLVGLLAWTLDRAAEHGRSRLHVAVGCTGGRHRSVVVATLVAAALRRAGYDVLLRHRDVERPDPR